MTLLLLLQVLVERPLPADLDASKPWRVVCGGREVPAQVREGRLLAIVPSRDAAVRAEAAAPAAFPGVEAKEVEAGRWEILAGGRSILRYHAAEEAASRRSGFVHPIWTPDGKVVTGNAPPHHRHHSGIWSGWKILECGGRAHDAWQLPSKTARVEALPPSGAWGGPAAGGLGTRQRILSPEGRILMEESWSLRAWSRPGLHVIDLESSSSVPVPVVLKEFRYGGIGFRGPLEWEGAKGLECLTSDGKGREEGQGTRPAWVRWTGPAGTVVFISPAAAPPARIHPDEPFFNRSVTAAGDVRVEPGTPLVQRLRILVADGPVEPSAIEALR